MTNEIWSDENELEFLMGDMNGIAFEDTVPEKPKEVKITPPTNEHFRQVPSFPFYEHIDRSKKP